MLDLTRHQDSVGAVLRDGNDLIVEGKVRAEEEQEIRVQMGLLNNRWEELRLKALERQSKWVVDVGFILCPSYFYFKVFAHLTI